jgi:hypothetical protein
MFEVHAPGPGMLQVLFFSIVSVSKELSKFKLDLVGVQDVRWERGGTKPVGEYTLFY